MSINISTLNSILGEVLAERLIQEEKGYTPEHDAEHGIYHLSDLVSNYALFGSMGFQEGQLVKAREDFLKAAAVATATVELLDRKIAEAEK